MKKIALLCIPIICIISLCGCIDPPDDGAIEPETENLDIEWDLQDVYNEAGDEIIKWILSGSVTNNDERTTCRIYIRGYFYDISGKHLQYHEPYDYKEDLSTGESFDFEIDWYWGDTEGDLISEIDSLPQELTGECEIMSVEFTNS